MWVVKEGLVLGLTYRRFNRFGQRFACTLVLLRRPPATARLGHVEGAGKASCPAVSATEPAAGGGNGGKGGAAAEDATAVQIADGKGPVRANQKLP